MNCKMYVYVSCPRDDAPNQLLQSADVPHSFNVMIPFEDEQKLTSVLIQGEAKAVASIIEKLFPETLSEEAGTVEPYL